MSPVLVVKQVPDCCGLLQSCTEMVMPTCSNGVDDMFEPDPWNFTKFAAECYKTWKVVPRPRWIVEQYGGKNISAASNIIFRLDDYTSIYCHCNLGKCGWQKVTVFSLVLQKNVTLVLTVVSVFALWFLHCALFNVYAKKALLLC